MSAHIVTLFEIRCDGCKVVLSDDESTMVFPAIAAGREYAALSEWTTNGLNVDHCDGCEVIEESGETFEIDAATLTPHEAVNLASKLLQFATQARAS